MQVYGDHIELEDGTLVPGPDACHPALESCRGSILSVANRERYEIRIPVFGELPLDSDHVLSSTAVTYSELVFHPYRVQAVDDVGILWTWDVWMDQYKRGVATRARTIHAG